MIILSLPYIDASSSQQALPAADYTEYRLDYCKAPQEIDFTQFGTKDILTWRGLGIYSPYRDMMLESQALVDLDIAEAHLAAGNTDKLIVSLHLAQYKLQAVQEFLDYANPCFALKLVFEAESFAQIVTCHSLIAASGKRVIFNVTGRWAYFQRSLYRHFGSWAVYLYWQQSTYPGQLSYAYYRLIAGAGIRAHSDIYGIIGGEQVNRSLSLRAFNQHFGAKTRHYLPIAAHSAKEAIEALEWLNARFRLRAFSLTSPFKQSLPQALANKEGIYNSLLWEDNGQHLWQNSDLIALDNSLEYLKIAPDDTVFIYGSGDCAEAFIQYLQSQGYSQLFLAARNSQKQALLISQYGLCTSTPQRVKLLINASKAMLFDAEPGLKLPHFAALIELVYSESELSSLCAYAFSSKIPYIDGVQFFEWQHAAQKQAFQAFF